MNSLGLVSRGVRRLNYFAACGAASGVMTASAHAHPGHDLGAHDAGHLLSSPDHVATLAFAGVALWFGARTIQRRFPRMLVRAVSVAALLGALAWRKIAA